MAGVFAQLELSMIRDRVKSGMANAKAKGVKLGRKPLTKDDLPDIFFRHLHLYQRKEINKAEYAKLLGITRPTLDKYIRIANADC